MTTAATTLRPATAFFYNALYVLPVAGFVLLGGSYYYWIVSALALAVWIILVSGRSRAATVLACAVSSLAALGNIALATSLHVQRSGFNERFFHHLDTSTLGIAWYAYFVETVLAIVYWTVMTAAPRRLAQHTQTGAPTAARPIVWLTGAVAALTYAPAISLATYAQARHQAQSAPQIIVAKPTTQARPTADANRNLPNLVFIYAESLEASFGNADLIGEDMTPTLTTLEREAMRFTNMIQLPGASWTLGGMVASQCALPLALPNVFDHAARYDRRPHDPESTLSGSIERLLPNEVCLGDILKDHGYRNVYIGGARLAFAGKGNFLATHGYGEQYGWDELRSELPDPDQSGGWGLHDDDMLALAWKRLATLAQSSDPFSLMLLTVDTHDVRGSKISRSCGPRPLLADAGFAVRCADRLIADFITRVRDTWPDIVIVLMSDHLSFPNAITDRIEDANARKLRFATWGPAIEAREIARAGTHFDIAPTVLEILGLNGYEHHNLGASLLSFESPWLSHDVATTMRAPRALPTMRIAPGEPIAFEDGGRLVRIDGQTLVANRHGFALRNQTFMLRFHDDGRFDTALLWRTLDSLRSNEPGALVLGVSTNDRFKRAIGAPADARAVYFAGRVGGKADLKVGAIDERTEITLPEDVFRTP